MYKVGKERCNFNYELYIKEPTTMDRIATPKYNR